MSELNPYKQQASKSIQEFIQEIALLKLRIADLEKQLFDTKTNMAKQILQLQTELFVEREKRIAWQSERGEVER